MQTQSEPVAGVASAQANEPRGASLLGLPRELRDLIYQHTIEDAANEMVRDDDTVIVSPSAFEQPAICRVNKQLRTETLPLFDDFMFDLAICHLEVGPHTDHWVWKKRPYLLFEGHNSWTNFKEWVHLYWHEDDIPKISCGDLMEASTVERVCEPIFDAMDELSKAGVSWKVAERILENLKEVSEASEEMFDFWDL